MKSPIHIADYTYDLPEERIAKFPLPNREESKLLVYKDQEIKDYSFKRVFDVLPEKCLLVFNNTKVVQARLLFTKTVGAKPIEIFCLEPESLDVERAMAAKNQVRFVALVGNAKRWKEGLVLKKELDNGIILQAQKVGRQGDSFVVDFTWSGNLSFSEILEQAGKVPLPPYLNRDSEKEDRERYQTVYAIADGSVAAPTAGLHFTKEILADLKLNGIRICETTLHVGAGTFKPVSTVDVRDHDMHAEEIHISRNLVKTLSNRKQQILSVGTTSTRTLESLYWLGVKLLQNPKLSPNDFKLDQWDAYELPQTISLKRSMGAILAYMDAHNIEQFFTHTQLIITPGYKFRVIDGLFTNFHQPGSTLILLVAAVVGNEWKNIYQHALNQDYRFLSYGDSSCLFIPKDRKMK